MTVAIGVLALLAVLASVRWPVAGSAYAGLLAAGGIVRTESFVPPPLGKFSSIPQLVVFLLLAFAVARLAATAVSAERRGTHAVLALVALGSLAWAAAALPGDVSWATHGLWAVGGWCVVATAAAYAVSLAPPLRGLLGGPAERTFLVAVLAWLGAVGLQVALS